MSQEGTRAWRIRAFGALCVFAIVPLAILTIVTLFKVDSPLYIFSFLCTFSRKGALRRAKPNWQEEWQIWWENLRSWRNEAPTVASSEMSDYNLILH